MNHETKPIPKRINGQVSVSASRPNFLPARQCATGQLVITINRESNGRRPSARIKLPTNSTRNALPSLILNMNSYLMSSRQHIINRNILRQIQKLRRNNIRRIIQPPTRRQLQSIRTRAGNSDSPVSRSDNYQVFTIRVSPARGITATGIARLDCDP